MPLTAKTLYAQLQAAIATNDESQVALLIKEARIHEVINQDPRGFNNPSLLAQALTSRAPNIAIIRHLLSVKNICVLKQAGTDKAALLLLKAAKHLSPAQKQEVYVAMQARGLQKPSPFTTISTEPENELSAVPNILEHQASECRESTDTLAEEWQVIERWLDTQEQDGFLILAAPAAGILQGQETLEKRSSASAQTLGNDWQIICPSHN